MKRILGLGFLSIMLLATVGGGTFAWFSDTETSANNSLTAGTLDLNIDGGNVAVTTFSSNNTAPGDSGSGSNELENVGSLDGELDIYVGYINTAGGSGGTEFEDGVSNLKGVAEMALYIDVDQSGGWSTGDIGLKSDGTTYSHPTALDYATIVSYQQVTWDAVETLSSGAADDFTILWQIPTSAGNEIQGDSLNFDVTFTLEQAGAD
jgi:spore coat-associated protein N